MTTTKTASKKPADHKAKEVPFNQVEGHELLKPFDVVDAELVIDLLAEVRALKLESDDEREKLKASAQLLRLVRNGGFVADEEGFKAFATAKNMEKAMELVSVYVGELGKEQG